MTRLPVPASGSYRRMGEALLNAGPVHAVPCPAKLSALGQPQCIVRFSMRAGSRGGVEGWQPNAPTIDKTGIQRPVAARNQALTTPGSLAPQNLAVGPEQNPLCRIVDIGRESEGRFCSGNRPQDEPSDPGATRPNGFPADA